jgi:hypothetical protein
MIWPQGGAYMGLNVHVKCKYMCNRADLVIKGSHVKLWIVLYIYDKLKFIRYEKSMLPKSENSSLCKNIAVSLFTKRNKN